MPFKPFKQLLRQKKRLFWLAVWCTTAYLLLTELRGYHQSHRLDDPHSDSKVGLAKKEANAKLKQAIKFRSSSSNNNNNNAHPAPGPKSKSIQGEGYCSEKEYLEGSWVKRQRPLRDLKEVREAFGLQVSPSDLIREEEVLRGGADSRTTFSIPSILSRSTNFYHHELHRHDLTSPSHETGPDRAQMPRRRRRRPSSPQRPRIHSPGLRDSAVRMEYDERV